MHAEEPQLSSDASKFRAVSARNRLIVEGALLGDIAIVLLLGRVYLPIPIVRTLWRLLAAAPFVVLGRRQGLRAVVMSGLVSYALLTALVGPGFALTAIDSALASLLICAGMKLHLSRPLRILIAGVLYTVLDIVLPTIAFAFILRVPLTTIVADMRHAWHAATHLVVRGTTIGDDVLKKVLGHSAPGVPISLERGLSRFGEHVLFDHWIVTALALALVLGFANMVGYEYATDLVLSRLSPSTIGSWRVSRLVRSSDRITEIRSMWTRRD